MVYLVFLTITLLIKLSGLLQFTISKIAGLFPFSCSKVQFSILKKESTSKKVAPNSYQLFKKVTFYI